jgi:16S rRNA (guanine527-N7)-methyltransferase
MDTAHIAHLLKPFIELSAGQVRQVATHLDLLLKWNSKINLTSVRDPEEIVTRHYGESFFAARELLRSQAAPSIVDVGSGAGFPGIPFAILAPESRVTLIESTNKKTVFLNESIFALGLRNTRVFAGRAENYPDGSADVVTMRAVELFGKALPVAERLVKTGGRIALMIGESQIELGKSLLKTMDWQKAVSVPGGSSRVLLIGTKIGNVG